MICFSGLQVLTSDVGFLKVYKFEQFASSLLQVLWFVVVSLLQETLVHPLVLCFMNWIRIVKNKVICIIEERFKWNARKVAV